jgi:VWFA-related protein
MSANLPRPIYAFGIVLVAIFVGIAFPLFLNGQQSSQPAKPADVPQQSAPAVRISTRLVQVSVIVEEHGQPVTGLKQEDFALFDQGQPQKISFFSEHDTSITANASAIASAPPAPDVFSNRIAEKPGVPSSVTVILLDLLNTHSSDMAYARNQVVKFIEALQPQDRVALYGLSDQLYILHDFTHDATALKMALNHYKNVESGSVSASEYTAADTGDDLMDAFLNQSSQRLSDFFTLNRVENTAAALEAIGNHLASLPGRKNLVWVSSSFPFEIGYDAPTSDSTAEHRVFSKEIEGAAQALNNANVAIYPVDARALVAGPSGPLPTPQGRTLARPPRTPSAVSGPSPATLETMNVIAERTGGKAFYNTNDIKGAVRRAIDDSRVTYTLGYYPAHNQWDGRFREIKVELTRKGAQLRYRKGYFAFPGGTPDANAQKKVLADISNTPLEDTEFGLTIKADPSPVGSQDADKRKLETRLKFDTSQMSFEQKDGKYVDKVDVVWVQLGANGKNIFTGAQTVDLNLLPASFEKVKSSGLTLNTIVDLRANCTTLRVVARDQGSGVIGSVNVPLKKIFLPTGATPEQEK